MRTQAAELQRDNAACLPPKGLFGPISLSKEPYIPTKEHDFSLKEPYVPNKTDLHLTWKNPTRTSRPTRRSSPTRTSIHSQTAVLQRDMALKSGFPSQEPYILNKRALYPSKKAPHTHTSHKHTTNIHALTDCWVAAGTWPYISRQKSPISPLQEPDIPNTKALHLPQESPHEPTSTTLTGGWVAARQGPHVGLSFKRALNPQQKSPTSPVKEPHLTCMCWQAAGVQRDKALSLGQVLESKLAAAEAQIQKVFFCVCLPLFCLYTRSIWFVCRSYLSIDTSLLYMRYWSLHWLPLRHNFKRSLLSIYRSL